MKIGCHAVLYKEDIANKTDKTLKDLNYTGAEGIEFGSRFFNPENANTMLPKLEENSLEVFGLHKGCSLVDFVDDIEKCKSELSEVAKILKQTSLTSRIIMTGQLPDMDLRDQEDFGEPRLINCSFVEKVAKNIEVVVKYIYEEYGIQVLYHNHFWEFKNDNLIYNSLINNAPSLNFALDIGWAISENYDYLSTIKKYPNRFYYLHIRDTNFIKMNNATCFDEKQNTYTEIGEGEVNFKPLLTCMNNIDNSILVVEYEVGPVERDRYKNAIDYLNKVKKEITK
ncbi:MAG: sugar phosphate isomerase/epimerase family protein [Pleomorphochaeta sp.]